MSPEDKEILRQADLLRPDEKARWTFLGRHFGYPDCCIHFFCNEWQDIVNEALGPNSIFRPYVNDRHNEYLNRVRLSGKAYIPCPECLDKLSDK